MHTVCVKSAPPPPPFGNAKDLELLLLSQKQIYVVDKNGWGDEITKIFWSKELEEAVGRVLRVTGGFESFNGPGSVPRSKWGEAQWASLSRDPTPTWASPLFSMSPHQPIQFILKLIGTIDIKFTLTCVFIISQSRIKIFNLVTLRIWRTQCEMYW